MLTALIMKVNLIKKETILKVNLFSKMDLSGMEVIKTVK